MADTAGKLAVPSVSDRGRYIDPETGLQYLRARYYDPATGQFISSDPLEALTQQPYSYAQDDPINEVDPSGLCGSTSSWGSFWANCGSDAVNAGSTAASAVGTFVGNHYGQIAEGLAGAGCIAGLQPELCIIATGAAGITSEIQNATSSCPSVAGGLIDLLGLAPGLQVAGADAAGLLGAGRTAGNVFSGIVGGSAIVGGPAAVRLAEQQDGATQSSCGCQ